MASASGRKAYSTKLSELEAEAIQFASEIWPEQAGNVSELIREIIKDWHQYQISDQYKRDESTLEGGTRTQTLQAIIEIKEMLRQLLTTQEGDKYDHAD